jgi:hypothetical protein
MFLFILYLEMQTRRSHRLTDTSSAYRQVKANIVEPSDYIKNGMFPQTDRHTIHGQMKAKIIDSSVYINFVFGDAKKAVPQADRQKRKKVNFVDPSFSVLHSGMQMRYSHRLADMDLAQMAMKINI